MAATRRVWITQVAVTAAGSCTGRKAKPPIPVTKPVPAFQRAWSSISSSIA